MSGSAAPRAKDGVGPEYDYIVVGAGSAGCCVADRLSSDANRRVLLLEAGGKDDSPLIKMGIGLSRLMYDRSVSDVYETEPEPHLDGRRVHVVRGRVLGGCSSINGQVYMRGQRRDYDDWAALPGCAGCGYADLLPYFRKSEHFEPGPANGYHAKGGELNVTHPSWHYDVTDAFIDAAVSVGIPRNDDLNWAVQHGIGLVHVNQKNRQRWSSADAFLAPDVRARANLTIATHWSRSVPALAIDLSVGAHAPTVAVAERASDLILGKAVLAPSAPPA